MVKYSEQQGVENLSYWYVLLGPIIGFMYVVCLPFIAIATVLILAGEKIVEGVLRLVGMRVSFDWRPSEAYLSGKKRKKKQKQENES